MSESDETTEQQRSSEPAPPPRQSFPIAHGPIDEDFIVAAHARDEDTPPADAEATHGLEDGEGNEEGITTGDAATDQEG